MLISRELFTSMRNLITFFLVTPLVKSPQIFLPEFEMIASFRQQNDLFK